MGEKKRLLGHSVLLQVPRLVTGVNWQQGCLLQQLSFDQNINYGKYFGLKLKQDVLKTHDDNCTTQFRSSLFLF